MESGAYERASGRDGRSGKILGNDKYGESMITELRLGNFKAFADTQRMPIRPITLIFGANSAGKSSLIHGLLLAHHAMEKGELDIHRTIIGGESVDLGGFKQYIFNRDSNKQVEWSIELDASSFEGRLRELLGHANRVSISVTIGMGFKKEFLENLDENTLNLLRNAEEYQYSDFLEAIKKIQKEKGEETKSDGELDKYKYQYFTLKDFLETKQKPQIRSYNIEVDGQILLKMSERKGKLLQLDILNNDHPAFKVITESILLMITTTEKITDDDHNSLKAAVEDTVPKITADLPNFLPLEIRSEDDQSRYKESIPLMAVRKGYRQEDLKSALTLYLPRILDEIAGGLTSVISSQLKRLHYLGPLRSYPPRHLLHSQYHDTNWFAGGGYAWEEIRKNSELRKRINDWLSDQKRLSTTYELVVRHLHTIDDLDKHYSKQISAIENAWAEHDVDFIFKDMDGQIVQIKSVEEVIDDMYSLLENIKAIEPNLTDVRELVLRDKRTDTIVSHRDVGIGISQVLPILVSAYGSSGDIIAIEQPEIHLHPALQAELGDVFIESALGENKNTYILETHSEHLILRILRRIRETSSGELLEGHIPIRPSDVSVIFAEPTPKGTILKELRITEDGEFADKWPGGFFPERAKELF
jgi:predicted ATPase